MCVSVQYMYDPSHVLAQNGLVGSRVVQQGMMTSPVSRCEPPLQCNVSSSSLQYVQTPSHHLSGYQVNLF